MKGASTVFTYAWITQTQTHRSVWQCRLHQPLAGAAATAAQLAMPSPAFNVFVVAVVAGWLSRLRLIFSQRSYGFSIIASKELTFGCELHAYRVHVYEYEQNGVDAARVPAMGHACVNKYRIPDDIAVVRVYGSIVLHTQYTNLCCRRWRMLKKKKNTHTHTLTHSQRRRHFYYSDVVGIQGWALLMSKWIISMNENYFIVNWILNDWNTSPNT